MKNKNIGKAILFASLLMINTNANGFHQCVPKKEWVEKIIKEKEEKKWSLYKEIKITRRDDNKEKQDIEKIRMNDLPNGHYVKFVAVSSIYGDTIAESLPFKIMDEIIIKPYMWNDGAVSAVGLYYQDEEFLYLSIPNTIKIYIRRS